MACLYNSLVYCYNTEYMTRSPKSNDRAADLPRSVAILLLATIADTTWRVFVPTIGGTLVGIKLDHLYNTAPWWTVATIITSTVISILLIILQIKSVRKK